MNLVDFIKARSPVLLDGAMGTQLDSAGLEMGGQNCLSHPDEVLAIHARRSAPSGHVAIYHRCRFSPRFRFKPSKEMVVR